MTTFIKLECQYYCLNKIPYTNPLLVVLRGERGKNEETNPRRSNLFIIVEINHDPSFYCLHLLIT